MSGVIGVRFVRAGRIHYFDPVDAHPTVNQLVVVETDQGLEMGSVAIAPDQVVMAKIKGELQGIVRVATPDDLQARDQFTGQANDLLERCRRAARSLRLEIKPIGAHFTLDGSKAIISYTCEEKPDLRRLYEELGQNRELRVELRQVGPRDETKTLGGLGRCGTELCCSTWLSDFQPISMRMAKEQDLPLSPPGLAGACGRLRCCLRYEYEQYRELKKGLPKSGARVATPNGDGVVVVGHPLKQTITVRLEETGVWVEVPMADIQQLPKQVIPPPPKELRASP